MFGSVQGISPSIYRGSQEGEVYITSWFPGYTTYKVSFSADTGRTFRHVYVITDYDPYNPFIDKPYFMSDREPGVFYIIRNYEVQDLNPWGWHIKICIEHYKDYGETLVNVYCHDLTKDYEYEETVCDPMPTHLASSVHFNSVQLQWSNPANNEFKAGYHIFRNHTRITNSLFTNTTYLDENLPDGDYEYQVVTYYSNGCLPDTSNYVIETVLTCEAVNDLASEKSTENSVLLTWSQPEEEVEIEGYSIYRNNTLLTEEFVLNTSYLDENLPDGDYAYYVVAHYANGCFSDSSNHVMETVRTTCKAVNDLASEKPAENSVLLTWSQPEEDFEIEGYNVYRNDTLLTGEFILNTSYLDENLPNGDYLYYVVAHYTNSCLSDSSNHVMETVYLGINEIAELAGLVIYPNPTTGELWILNFELGPKLNSGLNFELFDIYGKKINSKFKTQNSKFVTDISHLQAGVYFVRVITENGMVMRKVVKQ